LGVDLEGDLSTYIKALKKRGQRLSEKLIGYWFTQLLFGLRVLHSKNILHRDLKSANIFLTKNYSLKIGDFGISKVLERSSAITCIGTPLYLSPEVCNNQPYTYSSDMWALACIVYEMCSLRVPSF
jgi:NIMA (never in mitosis gene a)-related kinase